LDVAAFSFVVRAGSIVFLAWAGACNDGGSGSPLGGGAVAPASRGELPPDAGADRTAGSPRWSVEPSGVTDDLQAVWGSSATDVWIVGANGRILHSTGDGTWTPRASADAGALTAVWGNSAVDVFATSASGAL